MWNWVGLEDLDLMRRNHQVFEQRCEEAGRDPSDIERSVFVSPVIRDTEEEAMRFFRTQMRANRLDQSVLDDEGVYVTSQERMTELMVEWKAIGTDSFIVQTAAPFDEETAERFAAQVRPLVEAAA